MTLRAGSVLLGAGGHARVVSCSMAAAGQPLQGLLDPALARRGTAEWQGLPVLGDDDWLETADPSRVLLANGLGDMPTSARRREIFERWVARGFSFETVIHPSAVVSADLVAGQGVQLMAGTVIQPGVTIGANTVVNTRASVDHEVSLGKHVHVCPGAVLCGDVRIGDRSYIGPGAVIGRGVRIGEDCIIGAGSVVVKNVVPGARVLPRKPRIEYHPTGSQESGT